MKKFFALVLAVMLVMSLAVPAAAANYTITITNSDPDSSAGHTYEAYQIFKGDIDSTGTILTHIEWGENIAAKADDFLTALKAEPTPTDKTNEAFMEEVDGVKKNIFSSCTNADSVAKILSTSKYQTEAILKTFAKHATTYVAGTTPIETAGGPTANAPYVITIADKPGYYLVKDLGAAGYDKDFSDYILQVVGNVTVEHKGSIPTMDKQVSETGETYHDAIATGINETHYYRIIAELPDDYRLYDTYYLEFSDKMSKQLTFDEVVEVKALIRSSGATLTIDPSDYTVTTTTIADDAAVQPGGTHLRVVIENTKAIEAITKTAIPMNSEDAIEIVYTAKLNSNAIADGNGIPNQASIIYSNDPNTNHRGESTPDETNVYPINLKLIKIDGKTPTEKLDGAKFLLIRQHSDGSTTHDEYAKVVAGKIDEWVHHYEDDTCVADNAEHNAAVAANKLGTILETDANGEINVKGLDAGRYELEEIAPPDGYNALAERIIVTTSVTVDEENDKISGMTGTTNQGSIAFTPENATVSLTIPNHKGDMLPSTGGMGTTLFYVIGSVLVMGALVMLITKKRMAAEN